MPRGSFWCILDGSWHVVEESAVFIPTPPAGIHGSWQGTVLGVASPKRAQQGTKAILAAFSAHLDCPERGTRQGSSRTSIDANTGLFHARTGTKDPRPIGTSTNRCRRPRCVVLILSARASRPGWRAILQGTKKVKKKKIKPHGHTRYLQQRYDF